MITRTGTKANTGRRTRARKLPAIERRRQILEAAIRVFARGGYAAGTSEIAEEAGVGEPTIYRYFANKRDLYLAALDRTGEEVRENWERIAADCASPCEAIDRIGMWYYRSLRERPELLLLRFRSFTEHGDDEARDAVRSRYRQLMAFIESLYERAKSLGEIPSAADARALAWRFMATGAMLDVDHLLDLGTEISVLERASPGREWRRGDGPPSCEGSEGGTDEVV